MKAYESIKSIPVNWLEEIPEHWSVRKLKYATKTTGSGTTPPTNIDGYYEGNICWIQSGDLYKREQINKTEKKVSSSALRECSALKLYEPPFLVIAMYGASIGNVAISNVYACVNQACCVLIPDNDINIRFLFYGLKACQSDFITQAAGGTQPNISQAKIREEIVPIPPREEQDQIVRFLDWKVSGINRLISIRKRQIDELEESKRSKIGHLVMGKTADVPQKETAISWVKTIPDYWVEKTLIQVAEEQQIKNTGMMENNLLSLSYGKIVNKDINTTDGLLPSSFEDYQIVHNGNIVLRLTDLQNDHKSLRTGLATQTGIITSAYTCLNVRKNILPEYLQLELHVADLCKVFYGMGGGVRQSIGFKEIRKLIIAVPPIEEQRRILENVHGIEKPINLAIQKNKDMIAELEDLKTRLISDVVTGKIDVRNVEIPEYEFVEEDVDTEEEIASQEY